MKRIKRTIVCLAILTGICGSALGATSSGLSNIFTIDNRDTEEGPFVTVVSSQYCSQSQEAYFLAGVSLELEFTAEIDWADKTPSQVKWYRGSVVIATDTIGGDSVSRTFNVGTEFGAGEKLYVQAVAGDGAESAKVRANFEVVSPPPGLPAWILFFQHGEYKSFPFNIGFPELEKDPPSGSDDNTLCDNAQVSWKSIIEVTAETDLNGHTEITASSDYLGLSKDDFKISNISVDGTLSVVLTYDYADGQWRPGGGFDLTVSGKYQSPPTYVIFVVVFIPVPTYYRFAVDASVSANCRFTDGSAERPVFSGVIPVGAGLEGMAGVGAADVLAVEGYLRGGVNFEFQVPEEPLLKDWYLSLDGGIRIVLIFYTYENNLLSYRWPEEKAAGLVSAQGLKAGNFGPMPRDYLKADYARWYGSAKMIKPMDMQPFGKGGTETTLQTNIFGQSDAVLAVSGGTKCLVWLYDEPSRNSLDRTMLVYSINNGGGWSEPNWVDDDGTADAMPALAVDAGGNFICAWANASQLIPEGTDLSGFADKLDIQRAVYDNGTDRWTSETVTSEGALDYNPKIACDGGGSVTVVWTHDNNNDILAENPPVTNTLFARTKTSSGWEAAQTIATVSELVKYSDAEADAINSYIVYCVDTDSNLATDTDNELFYTDNAGAGWSAPIQLTNDPNADVNPQFVKTSTDLMLVWARDGKIVSTTDITGMTGITDVVSEEGSSGQRSFTATVSPTDNISVVWNDPSEEGSDIYTASYDPIMMCWSGVVQITDNRDMERSITAAYSAGDTLDLAYNKVHIEDGNGLAVFGEVDLCVYEYSIAADLAVTAESIRIVEPNAVPGDTAALQATIANNGDIAINNIPVAFYCGQTADPCNQIDETQMIIADLAAGNEFVASVRWTIPESNEPLNVIVVIDPNLQIEDKNRQNNSASAKMFGANVSIENVVIGQDAERNFYIAADILNSGFIPVSEYVSCIIVDSNDPNTVFDIQQIAIPDPNQSHTIILTVAREDLDYGLNEFKLIVDPNDQLEESSKLDNVRTLTLKNTPPGDFVIDGIIDALDLEVLASQWLQEPGTPSADIAPWPTDEFVNFRDFALLTEQWLETFE